VLSVDGEGRGRGGRGRGRGDRGRGRGRPFDRHSAAGKTYVASVTNLIVPLNFNWCSSDSDKKIHQAWGGDEGGTELKAEEAGTTDAQAEGAAVAADDWTTPAPADDWGAPPTASDPWSAPPQTDNWGSTPAEGDGAPTTQGEKDDDDRKPRERELEEEDNTISYDQYIAQMKENTTASVPKLDGVREANEGANATWDDVVEHKKGEDEAAYYVGKVCGVLV
jgi:plasminogen activator inhibitor 1 RNA-binding protein